MSTIVAAKTTLTRFKITGDRGDIERHFASAREDFTRARLHPIDDMPDHESASGLVRYGDYLSTDFASAIVNKGPFIACKLRIDTRQIKPSLLKKELLLAERDYLEKKRNHVKNQGLTPIRPGEEQQKKVFITKDEKTELRESVKLRLMKNTAPAPDFADVVIAPHSQTLYLTNSTKKFKDALVAAFNKAFQDLTLEEVTPSRMADMLEVEVSDSVGIDFLTHLMKRDPADGFPSADNKPFHGCIDGMVVLSGKSEGGKSETITAKGDSDHGWIGVKAEIEAGRKVSKAQVTFTRGDDSWTMEVYGNDFRIGGYKTPAVSVRKEDASDTDTILMEKMHLVERGCNFLDNAFWSYMRNVYVTTREKAAA